MLAELQKLPPGIVERYLATRDPKSCGISKTLSEYIDQINFASNLLKSTSAALSAARKLQAAFPDLSLSTCRSRISDAINFLHTDSTVTSEAWNNYFADQMMKLRDVALVAHKFSEARRCMENARSYRIAASASNVNPELTKFRPQLVSSDFKLERMGIDNGGLLKAYKEAMKIIDEQDVNDIEKARLRTEVEQEFNIAEAQVDENK